MTRRARQKPHRPPPAPLSMPVIDEELDLHGMSVDEALAAVDQLLRRHRGRTGAVLRIIHGHSNGAPDSIRRRVRYALDTVWRRHVKRYRYDLHNPGSTLLEVSGL